MLSCQAAAMVAVVCMACRMSGTNTHPRGSESSEADERQEPQAFGRHLAAAGMLRAWYMVAENAMQRLCLGWS